MAHTPGPWQADDDEVWAGDVHLADCELYAHDTYYDDHDSLPGNASDNARLIATAPQLLEACEAALAYIDGGVDRSDTPYEVVDEVDEKLRGAIAAARGNDENTMEKTLCVLCDKEAVSTAAQIPVCEEHHKAYQEEGRKYLPYDQRVVWQSIQNAARGTDDEGT